MNTMAQALAQVIADRIEDVQFWIANGMTKEAALSKVKSQSTLGPAPWAQVEAAV